jgi:hypothetical protein
VSRKIKTDFRRGRKSPRLEKPRILIVCEDQKYSVKYLEDLCGDLRINSLVKVTGESGSAPQSVVDYACELALDAGKKDTSKDYAYDAVYCVIDKDEHPDYKRVVRDFNKIVVENFSDWQGSSIPQFKLITSVRCFEIWILLHLAYTAKAFKSQDLVSKEIKKSAVQAMKKKVSKSSSGTAKTPLMHQALIKNDIKQDNFKLEGINYSLYDISKEFIEEAIKNAKKLRKDKQDLHGDDDLSLRLNADSYTEIDLLVKDLRERSSSNR